MEDEAVTVVSLRDSMNAITMLMMGKDQIPNGPVRRVLKLISPTPGALQVQPVYLFVGLLRVSIFPDFLSLEPLIPVILRIGKLQSPKGPVTLTLSPPL